MGKERYYRDRPLVPVMWQNIGLGALAAAVVAVGAYVLVT